MIVTTNMEMSLKTFFKMIKSRSDVENVFNNLKNECDLDHCYVHGGNSVEAILYLIFISSNLKRLFLVRRLKKNHKTQREMVRLFLRGLYFILHRNETSE